MNILTMQGLSIDPVVNNLGGLAVVSQHEKLQQDIQTLLLTRRGSIPGNPFYGSTLHEFIFESSSPTNLTIVKKEIESILVSNYNFISSVEIDTKVSEQKLNISIDYTAINTNLSTKLEFAIPLTIEGRIKYE